MDAVSLHTSFDLVENYVCSACWSSLISERTEQDRNIYYVKCEHCQEQTKGFVSKKFVEWKTERNEFEYREARLSLRRAYPFLFPNSCQKSIKQNLKELGV